MTFRDHLELVRHLAAYLASRRRSRDPEAVRDWQGRRLRRLVNDAYNHVPLYRRKYDEAGVRPEDIRSLADLDRLPILTKPELARAEPRDILNTSLAPGRFIPVKTSGSTGVPLTIFKDRVLLARLSFIKVAFPLGLGLRWRKPRLPRLLGVFALGTDALERALAESEPGILRFLPRTWEFIDARKGATGLLTALDRRRPDIVIGYPSVLAMMIERAALDGRRPSHQPAAWVLTAEALPPDLRKAAAATFDGEIFDFYSSTEASDIALECRAHRGLHIQSHDTILEIVEGGRPVPPGVTGNVVVTDLWNRATPIIRYAGLGDRAALTAASCSCGNPAPRLVPSTGRRPEALRLANGRTVPPFVLTFALDAVSDIAAYQITQTARDRIKCLIVPGPRVEGGRGPGDQKAAVEAALLDVLGPGIAVSIEQVAEIAGSSNPGFLAVLAPGAVQEPAS
jgi:phenylacetate-CoA ligase